MPVLFEAEGPIFISFRSFRGRRVGSGQKKKKKGIDKERLSDKCACIIYRLCVIADLNSVISRHHQQKRHIHTRTHSTHRGRKSQKIERKLKESV